MEVTVCQLVQKSCEQIPSWVVKGLCWVSYPLPPLPETVIQTLEGRTNIFFKSNQEFEQFQYGGNGVPVALKIM